MWKNYIIFTLSNGPLYCRIVSISTYTCLFFIIFFNSSPSRGIVLIIQDNIFSSLFTEKLTNKKQKTQFLLRLILQAPSVRKNATKKKLELITSLF